MSLEINQLVPFGAEPDALDVIAFDDVSAGPIKTFKVTKAEFLFGVLKLSGGTMTGNITMGANFIDFTERATPANPAADILRLYALDVDGSTQLAYKENANEITFQRSVTIVVAANDANAETKAMADRVCNGTNDEVEIQAAIDAVTTTGGTVLLSEGTFTLFASVNPKANVHLKGSGFGTILIPDAATSNFEILLISTASWTNIIISDMQINGDRTNHAAESNQRCIRTSVAGNRIILRDLYLHDMLGTGIQINAVTQFEIQNCIVNDCTIDGITCGANCHFGSIYANSVLDNEDSGIVVSGSAQNTDITISNNTVRNDAGVSVGFGIFSSGVRTIITSNIIEGTGTGVGNHGIAVQDVPASILPNDVIISNNIIKSPAGDGINVANNATTPILITGNTITDAGIKGIHIVTNASNKDRVIISNNIVHDGAAEGIMCEVIGVGNLDNVLIIGNISGDTRSGGSRTQTYGFRVIDSGAGAASDFIVSNNDFSNNVTATISVPADVIVQQIGNLPISVNTIVGSTLAKMPGQVDFEDTGSAGLVNMARLDATTFKLYELVFLGKSSTDVQRQFGKLIVSSPVNTNGIEDAKFDFSLREGGVDTEYLSMNAQAGSRHIFFRKPVSIPAGQKFLFDGAAAGDTSIREAVANEMVFETGGIDNWTILANGDLEHTGSAGALSGEGDIRLGQGDIIEWGPSTSKMRIDAGPNSMGFGLFGNNPAVGSVTVFEFFDANSVMDLNFLIETGGGTSIVWNNNPDGGTAGSTATVFQTDLRTVEDTGTRAAMEWTVFKNVAGSDEPLATRPLYEWFNDTTSKLSMDVNGNLDFKGNKHSNINLSDFDEIVTPANPPANHVRVYGKLSDSVTKLFYKQEDGVEVGPLGVGTPEHITILADKVSVVWTNQPAALTEIFGGTECRVKADATNHIQCRLVVNVISAGFAGATIHPEYDAGSGFLELADTANQMDTAIDATGLIDSGFVNIDALAKADITIRIVGEGGDAMADPDFTVIHLEFK